MAYNEHLAGRLRNALAHLPLVQEKKMFGGPAFMVDDKMCLTVGADDIMCRIDPDRHEEALKRKGSSTVIMKGSEYRGWINVNEDGLQENGELDYWVKLAIDFNKHAKASGKSKKGK